MHGHDFSCKTCVCDDAHPITRLLMTCCQTVTQSPVQHVKHCASCTFMMMTTKGMTGAHQNGAGPSAVS